MHTVSLYLDTLVIAGYFDAEFMADTRALWRLCDAGRFRFVSSVVVDQEIAARDLRRVGVSPAVRGGRCAGRAAYRVQLRVGGGF